MARKRVERAEIGFSDNTISNDVQSPSLFSPTSAPTSHSKPQTMDQQALDQTAATLDKAITFIINSTYLHDSEKKLDESETKESGVSKSIIITLNHYFPDQKYDHPLISLAISSFSLGLVIISKKPLPKKDVPQEETDTSASGEADQSQQSASSITA